MIMRTPAASLDSNFHSLSLFLVKRVISSISRLRCPIIGYGMQSLPVDASTASAPVSASTTNVPCFSMTVLTNSRSRDEMIVWSFVLRNIRENLVRMSL